MYLQQLVSKFALHHLDFQGITGDKIDPTQSKLFYDTHARFSFMLAASTGDVSMLSMLVESGYFCPLVWCLHVEIYTASECVCGCV